ncbi:hypothetical protein PWT90_10262 [Aphanocladium album]|nr:hypothetical protein PWT90_10262 [Aphanocladium album]
MVLIDVGVISSGASYAAPIIPGFLLVVYLVQRFYLGTSRQLRSMDLDNAKLLTRHLSETAGGIEHLRAAGARCRAAFVRDLYAIVDLTLKPVFYLYTIQQWLRSVMDLTSAVCAVAMVSLALRFRSSASPASMGLALLSLISFSETAALFVRFYVNMEMAAGSVARIRAFVQGTPVEKDGDERVVPEEWPQSGKLEMSGVTAVYKWATSVMPDSEKPHTALDNMTVSIQSGDTVGYSGRITLDGVDITTVSRDRLRRSITTITQAGLELNGSVRFNLDPFKFGAHDPGALPGHGPYSRPPSYPTDNDLTESLREVGLLDLVTEAGGLDATMTDLKLSHGQRQLFQLARALVHHGTTGSRVLLMDEGTASMDGETEARVKRVMAGAFAGCTRIIISHRPALLAEADLMVHLDHGKAEITRSGQGKVGEAESSSSTSPGLHAGEDE